MSELEKYQIKHTEVCTSSDDPDTQTAALLISEGNVVLSCANKFPRGLHYINIQRPGKYIVIEHAERGLIAKAAKEGISTYGLTVFMRWFPCAPCARAIINAGIGELICDRPDLDNQDLQDKWNFKEALEMLENSEVKLTYL